MMRFKHHLARFRRDQRGAMMIETAIVAPVLILMSMGAFQISQVIARQSELQGAMAEASAIAVSSPPDTADKRAVLRNVIVASTNLAADKVTVSEKYRCGAATTFVNSDDDCVDTEVSTYVLIQLDDTYTPVWTQWGFGQPINFNVDRYVMVKQS
jgi:Flp pilus assembly protein TadG